MEKMAGEGEEEIEYESDPEEAKMSLKMRRREASDDEEEEDEEEEEEEREREVERRRREAALPRSGIVDSEGESDGQGAAADYDDDEEEEDEEEDGEEYYDEQEYEVEGVVVFDAYDGGEVGGQGVGVGGEVSEAGKAVGEADESGKTGEGGEGEGEGEGEGGQGEGEKKENEPFAVPTTGAFYMHDDRFKDNAGGRHRRTFGGRKLWESKDERKWGHDKFEEMNTSDRHFEEGRRSSRGSSRGRGKARGPDRGFARGSRMRGYDGNNNQSAPPRDVRGRGPRRYQPSMKNRSETFQPHNKQLAKSLDKKSHAGSGRAAASTASLDMEHESVPAKKVASNLNSASPPFYPSATSNKDVALPQKKEAQAGNHSRNIRPSAVDHNFSVPHSTSMLRGKNVIDSMGMDKLHINDPVPPAKPLNNVHMQSSASPSVGAAQMTPSRAQGRGVSPSGPSIFQPQTNNQFKKVSPPAPQVSQQTPVQSRGQTSQQTSGQQLVQRPPGGSQSSPPKTGKGNAQGTGRGALVYGGGGPGGNMGSGDPNLPAFFPANFMQFGGQHPGGIGVPAVGMAFPGYVAQPNGLGNSEMTWLPVLASAAGALGASYCNPYMAVDGSYNPRPTGQPSALPASSKENNNLSKPSSELKLPQISDVANDEFSQRQNKPRRYSEMNFSQ
ncbi:protein MLN51 homolog isoform X2 [Chenopodium quinoa]|uniref:protein MLN51 homolog isoform X2 n=1 Tax=Chenopodium quinoa TaxID=63459 RepID=UPI000B770B0D|nr:protein MLN51 homolog isoform X2 [Chenopodium quinoa]